MARTIAGNIMFEVVPEGIRSRVNGFYIPVHALGWTTRNGFPLWAVLLTGSKRHCPFAFVEIFERALVCFRGRIDTRRFKPAWRADWQRRAIARRDKMGMPLSLSGGHSGKRPAGESHGNAKLTESDVRQIRTLAGKTTYTALAARFGVTVGTIGSVISRKRWQHIL